MTSKHTEPRLRNRAATVLTVAAACAVTFAATAQSVRPTVTASVSPDSVMIGDRFTLEIVVDKDQVQSVAFPQFGQSRSEDGREGSLECMREYPEDTLSHEGRRIRLRKRYELAAFDEGVYSLGRAQVLYADKNIVDTLYADEPLQVNVATFQIDSTSHAIFDIKPQKTLPFRFGEISGYLLWALLALVLVGLAAYGLKVWLNRHGRRFKDLFKPAPPLPPHVVAISALEELHNRKLWQNNKHKLYYSGLSDILRTYLAGRFGVGAMEMTTDEIVEAIRTLELPKKSAMDLVAVLRDADLVKFAKAMPEADENEDAYNKAYYFVEETKPVEEQPEEDEDAPTTNDNATAKAGAKENAVGRKEDKR